jgi:pimeloyl-ACP methyl ester carboxylesterase
MPTESSLARARYASPEVPDYITAAPMRVRPSRRATVLLAARVPFWLAESALGLLPLEDALARAIIQAPNAGRSEPAPMTGEIRVAVGPPRASIALATVDPAHGSPPRATVFVLHGIRDRKEAMRPWATMLARAGYRAVLVDLRGHGRSTGDVLTYGVVDAVDLSQVLDALADQGRIVGPVGVMGHSYGAATAIQWAGRDARVAGVVAVAPFTNLRDVVPGYTIVPLSPAFVARVVDRAGKLGGFDPDAASPLDAITRARAPVLLVHGRADRRIPPSHSQRLHAAAPDHSELVLVDGAGHDDVTGAPGARLAERTVAWFSGAFEGA